MTKKEMKELLLRVQSHLPDLRYITTPNACNEATKDFVLKEVLQTFESINRDLCNKLGY